MMMCIFGSHLEWISCCQVGSNSRMTSMGRHVTIKGDIFSVCPLSGWGGIQRFIGAHRVENVYLSLGRRYVHVLYRLFLFCAFLLISVVVRICVHCACRSLEKE